MEPAFRFVGGDPALDLINTVDWLPGDLANELLVDHARLTAWAEGAGVASRSEARRQRALAGDHPRRAASTLARARSLRATLQRVFAEVAAGAPSRAVLDELERWLPPVYSQLRLAPATTRRGGPAATWAWRAGDDDLDVLWWPVVRAAAALLTSRESVRVRVCGGSACGWMYVDRSRNGLRRWCQMETCGTREKSRRRRVAGQKRPPSATPVVLARSKSSASQRNDRDRADIRQNA